jgi:hypothetical protein
MHKQLQAAFQYYADKGQLMTIRRANTEEISLVASDGQPLATLRTERVRFIQDIWDTKELDADHVTTTLVCAYIPPIDKFEAVWEYFRGIPNVIVNDIKLHKGLLRDLSKEGCKQVTTLTSDDILPYMRTEDGWTNEMIDAAIKELERNPVSF